MNIAEQVDLPIRKIVLDKQEGCFNNKLCKKMSSNIRARLTGRYISDGTPIDNPVIVAHVDLRNLTWENYLKSVKKRYKGNVVRDARKADKAELVMQPFTRKNHIPDIVEINHSMPSRTGKPMRESYLKSVKELGGPPKKDVPWEMPECPKHYDIWWGAFENIEGYTQGKIQTNQKLIGYIDFRRVGNFSFYSIILGHGEYLKFGIMYRLHFEIMEWILNTDSEHTNGINTLMYAGFNQGGDGLRLWKKKVCFEPCYLAYGDV